MEHPVAEANTAAIDTATVVIDRAAGRFFIREFWHEVVQNDGITAFSESGSGTV
ncbi:hypothetical protein HNR15_002841 [Allobranchiibius huperziae]|uniref:Uncharacterized protein n=1 Tax=Allobranchiibius huperziae TaxID=1874116 RepID=A0A853DGF6_9MICO|nr:hypothetical protein [Allobranchiibius huperziae]